MFLDFLNILEVEVRQSCCKRDKIKVNDHSGKNRITCTLFWWKKGEYHCLLLFMIIVVLYNLNL